MPRHQYIMMGVQYAPAAIKKTLARRKALACVRELRQHGSKPSKYQVVQVPAAYSQDWSSSLRSFGSSAILRSAVKPSWVAKWFSRSDQNPSFAASAVINKKENIVDASGKIGSGKASPQSVAPSATSHGQASLKQGSPATKDSVAAKSNPLFRFAALGMKEEAGARVQPPSKPEPALREALGGLAAQGPAAVPASKPPSKKRLRSALLAYATM